MAKRPISREMSAAQPSKPGNPAVPGSAKPAQPRLSPLPTELPWGPAAAVSLTTRTTAITLEAAKANHDGESNPFRAGVRNRLDGKISAPAFSGDFTKLQTNVLLETFAADIGRFDTADVISRGAAATARSLIDLRPAGLTQSSSAFFNTQLRQQLAVLLYAATVMDESVNRVIRWAETLDTDSTAAEIESILEWKHASKQLDMWHSFTVREPQLRREIAIHTLDALKKAERHLDDLDHGQQVAVDPALTVQGQLMARAQQQDDLVRSSWKAAIVVAIAALVLLAVVSVAFDLTLPTFLFKLGGGAAACAFAAAFLLSVIRSEMGDKQARLDAWRQLADANTAPLEPQDSFTLLVAEKHVAGEMLEFACACYQWNDQTGWQRKRTVRLGDPLAGDIQFSWPADTPIEQLTSAWADHRQAVAEINEGNYREQLAAQGDEAQQAGERIAETQRQSEQLKESAQIAGLLPGPTVIPQPRKSAS